jgi:hypothetical protein
VRLLARMPVKSSERRHLLAQRPLLPLQAVALVLARGPLDKELLDESGQRRAAPLRGVPGAVTVG